MSVRFLARRVLHAALVVFVALAATFLFLHLAPGDPASRWLDPSLDPAAAARIRARFGLDRPLPEQFVRWVWRFLSGDFGTSITQRRPVAEILAETIPRTLQLTVLAFLVQTALGVAAGVAAAARDRRASGRAIVSAALVLYGVPTFYLAYLAIAVFALGLGWLPTSGIQSAGAGAGVVDRLRHLAMPVFVLGVAGAAALVRYTRGSVLDAAAEEFVRAARARGVPERRLWWRHALRAALPPILTVLGTSVPFLLGGAVVVEKVFAWPGMGALLVDAIHARDYPVVLAVNFAAACLVVLGNLAADVSYAIADPRIDPTGPAGDPGGAAA